MKEPITGARYESRGLGGDLLQLSTRIPSGLAERLKLEAIRRNVTVRDLVIEILDDAISDGLRIIDDADKKRVER